MLAAVAVPRHRHLDDIGREPRQLEPKRRCESTRRGPRAVTPHGRTDARGVGERAVVDEVHAASALPPVSRPNPPVDGMPVDSAPTGVGERQDSILPTETVIQHAKADAGRTPNGRSVGCGRRLGGAPGLGRAVAPARPLVTRLVTSDALRYHDEEPERR